MMEPRISTHNRCRGQAIIEFAISSAFIIVFAFMAARIAQWCVESMKIRQGNYGGSRVPAGSTFDAPDVELRLIN